MTNPRYPFCSVIIPAHNERAGLVSIVPPLDECLASLAAGHEIIIVDDASTDLDADTRAILADRLAVRILRFPARSGQTAALAAGFAAARGEYLVSLDGDGQDDPAALPDFLAALDAGPDAVCGWRITRSEPWRKALVSRLGNRLQRLFLGTGVHDLSCTYRAYRRAAVRNLPLHRPGYHRFIPWLLRRRGCRLVELPVRQLPRRGGVSKYGVGKLSAILANALCLLADRLRGRC